MNTAEKSLQEAVATLVRVLKILEPEIETAHGSLKLNPADIHTLRFVSEHPGCPSIDVARFLGVRATTMSSIVARLEKRGFLERTRPESDRRAIALSLTNLGRQTFGLIASEELEMARLMLSQLPANRHSAFVEDLTAIAQSLDGAVQHP